MRRSHTLIAAFAALALASCAVVVQSYTPPADGDTATLTVTNGTVGSVQVFIYRDAVTCKGRNSLPFIEPGNTAATVIRAGGPIAMSATASLSTMGPACRFMFSFDAVSSKKYVLRIRQEGNMCYFRLDDATAAGSEPEVPVRERTGGRGLDENSSFCDPVN